MSHQVSEYERAQRMEAFDKRVGENIARNGFSFIGVFPTADRPGPAFGYTVGLWRTYAQPEVFLVGLTTEVMHGLAWDIANLAKAGKRQLAGSELEGMLEGDYKVALRKIEGEKIPMNYALRYYDGPEGFEAVQMVFPDTQHRFPWDDGYDLDPRVQPLITGNGEEGL